MKERKKNTTLSTPSHTVYVRGFSTIELLIAFSVFVIFISASMMVAFGGQSAGLDTILDNGGLYRSLNKIGDATKKLAGNWNIVLSEDVDTTNGKAYTNTPTIVDISPCMKEVTNSTSWQSEKNRDRKISFGTAVSNIDIARATGPDGCDPVPPSPFEWDNPENPNWETSPSDIDGTQTGLDVITIDGVPYAFMTTTHTSQKDDLWAIDVSNTENPTVVGSLETGTIAPTNTKGLNDIDVVTTDTGTFAYVIQNSSTNQLQTIDVSNPTSLNATDITSTISLATFGVSPTGSNPAPKVITYYNRKLYVGLATTIGPEFLVFNVSSNPASPTFVGALSSSFDHSINDVAISGNYAYLAIAPGSGALTTKELMILDISNPTPIDSGAGFNATTSNNDTEAATALYLLGNTLYLGRQRVSNVSEKDFYAFNISNPTNPTVIKSKKLGISTGGSLGTPRVIDLVVHGHLGFFVTTDSAKPFQIYDVLSNPNDIVPINGDCPNYLNLPKLVEIVYKNNLIYGANGNQAALNILHDKPNVCEP